MAMNRAWLGLFLLVFSMSGCTWFGLVEEKQVSPFGIPEKGAVTLIRDVSSRTANVEFSGWYVEVLPHANVRVEGKAVSAVGISSLKSLMEATRGFQNVKHLWGTPSEYEEVSFGLRGSTAVRMEDEIEPKPEDPRGGNLVLANLHQNDDTGDVWRALSVEFLPSREWENGWRCDTVETRYTPKREHRLSLTYLLEILQSVEQNSKLVRSVIARFWMKEGMVSRAIVRWHCYRPPGE
ncbi:MAG: hypothetical protein QF645_06400 [Planctomycetota bacterium]|nr:hypothetical protein [Planctomycetota bacterium]